MNQIYLLQNQDKLFLSKQDQWLDGRELGSLYKARHKDEALNYRFEVNTRDYSQRIHVLSCSVKTNGLPQINSEDLPPPMEKVKATAHTENVESGAAITADDSEPAHQREPASSEQ